MADIAVLGFGARGTIYSLIAAEEGLKIVAACDVDKERRSAAKRLLGLKDGMCFDSAEAFFAAGRLADALILSTIDGTHYEYAMRALDLGYDILLEKPIALTLAEVDDIAAKAKALGRKIGVSHVLRYTPFYMKIKEIIDSGVIGRVMNVNQTENVGYFHQAHSFVRGNWHNSVETCPMILAKCCHDFDIILWLTGKSCKKLSSFGALDYFKAENAPAHSAARCKNCAAAPDCPYDAYQIYSARPTWVRIPDGQEENWENAKKVLDDDATFYDKCVFRCDNDVVDHQTVNMVLEDGIVVNLTMQAFSGKVYRRIQVGGTFGEINGVLEDNRVELEIFGKEEKQIFDIGVHDSVSPHAGGDRLLLVDFMKYVDSKSGGFKADIDKSVESHRLAFAAETSRLSNGKVMEF
ncbi:MAG: hypothetical protein DBX59_08015 [Bacillota bacterium]|nr:MAG: hypothetical protein DBX59_08015 [Bacillota bacterium]